MPRRRGSATGAKMMDLWILNLWKGKAAKMMVVILLWLLALTHLMDFFHTKDGKTMQNSSRKGELKIKMVTYVFGEEAANKHYLETFVESARKSGLDIAIIGSPAPPFALPPNVQHVSVTWDQFVAKVATQLFGGKELPELQAANSYKIIDFKPLFAFLFPELVDGYDWWGHLDNDMLLGDTRRFLTHEILSQNDIISGADPTTWGPFTMYRNSNITNELFRLVPLSLEKIFASSRPVFFDEWGQGRSVKGARKFSMSGIVEKHGERLGLRLHQYFPHGWDGPCKHENKGKKRCSECSLTMPRTVGNGDARQRQKLMVRDDLVMEKAPPGACSPDSDNEECMREIMLCHFQMGKSNVEKSLADAEFRNDLIHKGQFRVSFLEGFTPFPADDAS